MKPVKIAIVGATGAVGREMIEDLADTDLKGIQVGLFASSKSQGQKLSFREKDHTVEAFSLEKLKGYDFCLMSAGGAFSKEFSPQIVENGTTVIDNSSAWRADKNVPLIVPEVNGSAIKAQKKPLLIANPNCTTVQLVVALKPLYDAFGIDMVQVATYQSVSGTGQRGIQELSTQVKDHFNFKTMTSEVYAHPIAFNIIPAIDTFNDAGHCFEEIKVIRETQKILNAKDLTVFVTTARVPTFNCHCEAVTVKLKQKVTKDQVIKALTNADGLDVILENNYENLDTPLSYTGKRQVSLSRLRLPHVEDLDVSANQLQTSDWVQFWIVADNLKKGAATNAVQILQSLL